jgi:hypothetical protein
MPEVAFRTAIRDALDEELAFDERVILFGEDVAVAGGVFATTTGLYDKYGAERVFDTPISELALAGAAFGSAVTGLRPVVEIMFGDFLTLAMDSVVNQSTKYWFLTQGQVSVPLVLRSVVGAGGRFGAIHSQMPASWFMGVPGLKIVSPSTPADAKALLKAAIRDENPVLFFEHKGLYGLEGEVDGDVGTLSEAGVVREGVDIPLVTAMKGVHDAVEGGGRRPGARPPVGGGDRSADAAPVRRRDRPRVGAKDEPARGRRGGPRDGRVGGRGPRVGDGARSRIPRRRLAHRHPRYADPLQPAAGGRVSAGPGANRGRDSATARLEVQTMRETASR